MDKILSPGQKIPALGIGTYGMGGRTTKDTSRDEEDVAAIRKAIEMGLWHIDTAELYGGTHTEELVGKAIEDIDRKRLFITTKLWPDDLRPESIYRKAYASCKRMGIDYIDLYLIHWPTLDMDFGEVMGAMDSLVEKGKIRFIGVSNFSVEELKKAQAFSKNKIVINQVKFSLVEKQPLEELLPYCVENGIMVTAYEPLDRGTLCKPGYLVLDEIARRYGKTQAQVALNWLISQKNVITIPKATGIEHLKENLGALGWGLDPVDIKLLSKTAFLA